MRTWAHRGNSSAAPENTAASDAALQAGPGIIRELHGACVAVNVWTVDDPDRWDALERAGVDGIITNCPAELAGWNAGRFALAG
ncbi:glycerophosphodiester phosphodiesterase family protein [Kribbella sp. CA-245084]|uniref:glycerophosphodiester phosphodiesterase n=1 Tax=Kribbella sp. CA-245084 TaxID=3239940 RepID=UPI003D94EA1D